MAQLKRYNGASWDIVGGNIAPKTTQTSSDTDTYSCNYINDINKYSTSEVNTGKKWIDGKPIYRKTFTIGSVSAGSTVTLGTISNLDTPISATGFSYYGGLWTTIPRVHPLDSIYQSQVYIDSGDVKIACGSSSAITKGYLVLEYTKTTD